METENAKKRLEELKKQKNRPVDKETIEKLRELRAQVYSVKTYTEKLNDAKNRKKSDKTFNKHYEEYSKNKTAACSSTEFSVASIILSVLVVIAYVVFCILDAKKGWNILYPDDGIFTLTYLCIVLAIGIFGGAIAVGLIMLAGFGLDTLRDNISFSTYDARHKKELEKAKAADAKDAEEYAKNFEIQKEQDIKDATAELEKAQNCINSFTEIPADVKTVENIDRFFENMEFVMGDGVPYDLALSAFVNLFNAEKAIGIYYYSAFPLMKLYTEKQLDKLLGQLFDHLNSVHDKFKSEHWEKITANHGELFVHIFATMTIGKADINIDKIKEIKTKKECNAFYEETLKMNEYCLRILEKNSANANDETSSENSSKNTTLTKNIIDNGSDTIDIDISKFNIE